MLRTELPVQRKRTFRTLLAISLYTFVAAQHDAAAGFRVPFANAIEE
jgi:hypothetical protein